MPSADTHAIRVGLIYDGAVIEERIVQAPRPVSVGTELGATLSLDVPELPRQIALIDWRDGGYVLRAFPETDGRVRVDGTIESLDEARVGAETDGAGAALVPLEEVDAGRVGFGDAVVLFQRVSPAERPSPPSLPDELTRSLPAQLDRRLGSALAVAALLQIGFVAWAQLKDWPEPKETGVHPGSRTFVTADEMTDSPDETETSPEPTASEEQTDEPTDEAADSESNARAEADPGDSDSSDEEPEASDESGAGQRNVAESSVTDGTVLEALGSRGGEEMLAELETASADDEFDEAVANTRNDTVGPDRGQLETGDDDADTGRTLESDEIDRAPGSREAEEGVATGGPDEIDVRCRDCNGGSNGGPDDPTARGVGDVVERHAGRLRRCYERALKTDDDLAGKIIVSFRIDATGSPTALVASRDTVGGGVADCVLGIFRRMSFPSPDAESKRVDKTFVFEPAN